MGDSSRASWLDVPNKTSCLFNLDNADAGLSSVSATNFGLAAALAEVFFGLPFASLGFDAGLDVERLRTGFFETLFESSSAISFNDTLVVLGTGVVRRAKKSLETSGESGSGC